LQLTLALLVTRIGTDHTHNALAPNYLAVTANFLDRSRNLHFILLKLFEGHAQYFAQTHTITIT
jgi:hypothetical protein